MSPGAEVPLEAADRNAVQFFRRGAATRLAGEDQRLVAPPLEPLLGQPAHRRLDSPDRRPVVVCGRARRARGQPRGHDAPGESRKRRRKLGVENRSASVRYCPLHRGAADSSSGISWASASADCSPTITPPGSARTPPPSSVPSGLRPRRASLPGRAPRRALPSQVPRPPRCRSPPLRGTAARGRRPGLVLGAVGYPPHELHRSPAERAGQRLEPGTLRTLSDDYEPPPASAAARIARSIRL